MTENIVYITDQSSWYLASLAKKELAWAEKNNKNNLFDERIVKEKDFIRSFRTGSLAA